MGRQCLTHPLQALSQKPGKAASGGQLLRDIAAAHSWHIIAYDAGLRCGIHPLAVRKLCKIITALPVDFWICSLTPVHRNKLPFKGLFLLIGVFFTKELKLHSGEDDREHLIVIFRGSSLGSFETASPHHGSSCEIQMPLAVSVQYGRLHMPHSLSGA